MIHRTCKACGQEAELKEMGFDAQARRAWRIFACGAGHKETMEWELKERTKA